MKNPTGPKKVNITKDLKKKASADKAKMMAKKAKKAKTKANVGKGLSAAGEGLKSLSSALSAGSQKVRSQAPELKKVGNTKVNTKLSNTGAFKGAYGGNS